MQRRSSWNPRDWCGIACCVGQPCRRNLTEGEPPYTPRAYRSFMRKVWSDARKYGLFLPDDMDISCDLFIAAVEADIGMPMDLRQRLVTTGTDSAADLVTFRPGNIKWWRNQDG